MENCIFCQIVADTSKSSIVYEDSSILALMDIRPVTSGHTLVIPKKHYAFLADLEKEDVARLFKVTQDVAGAVRKSGVRCEGVNLFLADGEAAGQEVFHVHMHVIPRYKGDNFLIKPDYGPRPTHQELNEIATKIKVALLKV